MALPVEIVNGTVGFSGETVPVSIEDVIISAGGALSTRTELEAGITAGIVFYSSGVFTIGSNSTRHLLFDPTALPAGSIVVINPPKVVATAGPVHLTYRLAGDYTGGTAQRASNRFLGQAAPLTEVKIDPTGTAFGDSFSEMLIPASTDFFASNGEEIEGAAPIVAPAVASFVVSMENEDNVSCQISYNILWYELTV